MAALISDSESGTESGTRRKVVYVVDDDPLVLNAVREALESGGYHPRTFSHATELIEQIDPDDTGCVVTDLQMPGMNGMELQQALISKDSSLSLIMLTGYADVSVAVEVMRRGAVTLLEKPFKVQRLKEEVRRAVDQSQRFHSEKKRVRDAREAIESLTSEELAVLDCASRGKPNKAIGYELALSGRTVDRRRQSGLRKLNVDSISEFAVIRATAEDKRGVLDQRPR